MRGEATSPHPALKKRYSMEIEYDVMRLAKAPEDSSNGVFPIFHHETRRDDEASEAAGKAVYKAVPYVEIIAPGNDKEKINRRVKEEDKRRWPEQWKNFVEGREAPEFDGMPISQWPMADIHLDRTLRESNIFTVEQLANVADVDLQMLGPGMTQLKNKAMKWVKSKEGQNEELQATKKRIKELEEEVESIKAGASEGVTKIEPVIKSGGWYTYQGVKYRESDLPEEVKEAIREPEK